MEQDIQEARVVRLMNQITKEKQKANKAPISDLREVLLAAFQVVLQPCLQIVYGTILTLYANVKMFP